MTRWQIEVEFLTHNIVRRSKLQFKN